MRRLSLVAALACAAAAPACAGFVAQNGLVVESQGQAFDVPYRGLSGDSSFWCAAGDYTIRGLGLPPATRVYRLSEPRRGSGEDIRFSLSPEGAATRTGLFAFLGRRDGSLTAAMAQSFCEIDAMRR